MPLCFLFLSKVFVLRHRVLQYLEVKAVFSGDCWLAWFSYLSLHSCWLWTSYFTRKLIFTAQLVTVGYHVIGKHILFMNEKP
jgi:hypothetical protein